MAKKKQPTKFDVTIYPICGVHDVISIFQMLFPEQRLNRERPLLTQCWLREDTVLVPQKFPASVTWEFELKPGGSFLMAEVEIRTALTRMLRARTVQFSKLN